MDSFLKDCAKGIGSVIGGTVGMVAGLSYSALAAILGVSVEVINSAVKAGCKTKEEIEHFIKYGW
jgi:hypothetical protein